MMKKSWADCSSDEEDYSSDDAAEDEDEEQETLEATALEKLQINNDGENLLNNSGPGQGQQQSSIREYDYPDRAPFNAFVGNLSYDISEVSHLQQALADVVHDRLKENISIIGAKICYDRNSGDNRQHRGFGYVELETLEEVSECLCAT
jgi:hypothetical protein